MKQENKQIIQNYMINRKKASYSTRHMSMLSINSLNVTRFCTDIKDKYYFQLMSTFKPTEKYSYIGF